MAEMRIALGFVLLNAIGVIRGLWLAFEGFGWPSATHRSRVRLCFVGILLCWLALRPFLMIQTGFPERLCNAIIKKASDGDIV